VNHAVSVIFRAIPLAMMAVCVGFGLFVLNSGDASGNFVAGRVVTGLGVICLCLFCTAATIIRQLIGRYTTLDRIIYPTASTWQRRGRPYTARTCSSGRRAQV
jgi:Protein of unknown function (DUF2776)